MNRGPKGRGGHEEKIDGMKKNGGTRQMQGIGEKRKHQEKRGEERIVRGNKQPKERRDDGWKE